MCISAKVSPHNLTMCVFMTGLARKCRFDVVGKTMFPPQKKLIKYK